MPEMSDDQKRKAKQSMIDAANMGGGQLPGAAGELQQAITNRFSAPVKQQGSTPQMDQAAIRNAEINHRLMMEQIAKEKAARQMQAPAPVEPQMPDVDPAMLAQLANENADRQLYPDRFKNLKKPRGK